MAARLIRDGILESEAVLSLPVEARWLYVSILLSADDVGLFEATPFRLARRADVRRELADTLLQMLVDHDLVRLYEVAGKRFGFIPRYGQRVQIKRARCPLPPETLLHGDDDAINKIKHLGANPAVDFGDPRKTTAIQQPEPEPEPEVIPPLPTVEETREPAAAPRPRQAKPATPAVQAPDDVEATVWSEWLELRRRKKATVTPAVLATARTEAAKAGLSLEDFLRIWVYRGSQGLFADWLKPAELAMCGRQPPRSFSERASQAAKDDMDRLTGRRGGMGVVDVTPRPLELPNA